MSIVKQQIREKTQKFQAKWTITFDQSDPEQDPGLEDEVAKILQEEIDWEVMIDILIECSWTKIEMDWPARMSEVDAHEIKEWCRSNLKGNYQGRAKIWLFEKEKDATMFLLRWV